MNTRPGVPDEIDCPSEITRIHVFFLPDETGIESIVFCGDSNFKVGLADSNYYGDPKNPRFEEFEMPWGERLLGCELFMDVSGTKALAISWITIPK